MVVSSPRDSPADRTLTCVTLSAADRVLIHELLNTHGHLMDHGQLDRLDELFTPDVEYDLSAYAGGPVLRGWGSIRGAALELGDRNPLAHHVTNIVITSGDGVHATVLSKGLAVMGDGTSGSVVYEDEVVKTDAGWRLSRRRVIPRRTPLTEG